MNARAPRAATREAGRKKPKLKLSKETLKELAAPDKDIKGGVPVDSGRQCQIVGNATNGCES